MCGICGKFLFDPEASIAQEVFRAMPESMSHRGPDDQGMYIAPQIALGHRRLSIIGLGTGHQPLTNEDETVWITFNGEIYNYRELRRELVAQGHRFRTETDTEVIVHLYEEFGEQCVQKLRGMFAFGLWDRRKRLLLLARDRVGIKPLYYKLTGKGVIFASEIKALVADRDSQMDLDTGMIDRFLAYYYMPGEETLFKDVRKLPPASYMVVQSGRARISQYWELEFGHSELRVEDAETQLLENLQESVRLHLISDVPVGVLLSGGLDSTAVLSLARQQTAERISSYTVGFDDPTVEDERPYARIAAAQFGTEHHEITISAEDFQDFLPRFVWHMEEPVCEPPAVALYYVSKLASNYVKVLLSGEGGDEAFAGYSNYRNLLWAERVKRLAGPFASALAATIASAAKMADVKQAEKYAEYFKTPFPDYYFSRTSNPSTYFNRKSRVPPKPLAQFVRNAPRDVVHRMLYVDTKTWLPDDLLIKADKITMANSVELRVPLLDHKVLEFAASLPSKYKVNGFTTKYLAKRSLQKLVPPEIVSRKKAGFPVPYASWLRTQMKDWLRDLLTGNRSFVAEYFGKAFSKELIAEDARTRLYSKELFSLAVLELWHRAFIAQQKQSPTTMKPSGLVATGNFAD